MPGTVEAHVCGVLHLPQTQPFIHSSSSYELNIKQWWWLLCLVFIHMSVCIKWTTNSIVTRCSHCSLGKAITSRGHSSSLMTWKTKYIHLFWQETNPNLWPKQAADLELFPFSGCTCPSCHQHIPKSVRSIDVSMKTDRDFGGGGLVRESPEGPPGASSFSFTSKKAPAEVWIMDNKCAFWCLPPPGPIPSCHRKEKKQKRADRKSR